MTWHVYIAWLRFSLSAQPRFGQGGTVDLQTDQIASDRAGWRFRRAVAEPATVVRPAAVAIPADRRRLTERVRRAAASQRVPDGAVVGQRLPRVVDRRVLVIPRLQVPDDQRPGQQRGFRPGRRTAQLRPTTAAGRQPGVRPTAGRGRGQVRGPTAAADVVVLSARDEQLRRLRPKPFSVRPLGGTPGAGHAHTRRPDGTAEAVDDRGRRSGRGLLFARRDVVRRPRRVRRVREKTQRAQTRRRPDRHRVVPRGEHRAVEVQRRLDEPGRPG